MKKVLSLLLSFVFLQTQSWALSGGPQYGGGSQVALAGTYAGTLVGNVNKDPEIDPVTGEVIISDFGTNAMGVFSLGVPTEDLAQGAIVLFLEGSFFQGGMIGVADPGEGQITALCQIVRVVGKAVDGGDDGGISIAFDARADGELQAETDTGLFGLRLDGEANYTLQILDFDTFEFVPQGTLNFSVSGFKQSETVITPDPNTVAGLLNQ